MQRHSLKNAVESRIKHGDSLKWRILMVAAVFAAIVAAGPTRVSLAQSSADPWRFEVTPYFWLINFEGNLRYSPIAGGSPHVEISNDDLLDMLDFGFMLSGEARKGRWSIFTDVIYFDLSSEKSRVKAIDFDLGGPSQSDQHLFRRRDVVILGDLDMDACRKRRGGRGTGSDPRGSRRISLPCGRRDYRLAVDRHGHRPGPGPGIPTDGEHLAVRGCLGRHCGRAGPGAAWG